ncbi:MAG: DUF6282 family protein [Dehalococcoidia bacterium]
MARHDFLDGAIDTHVHSGPDVISRWGTSIDIARQAAAQGMRAIVLKDHLFPSVFKAHLTEQAVPEIRVFGGITLNRSVGGFDLRSVRAALAAGARVVMFPTFDAKPTVERVHQHPIFLGHMLGTEPRPLPVVGEDGRGLVDEAESVLQEVAQHPEVILSTGHLGPKEAIAVVERGRDIGIAHVVVEHPNAGYPDIFTMETLKRLADAGAYLALNFNAYHPAIGRKNPEEAVAIIQGVGPERCTLITDGGQPYSPSPPECMRMFCEMLYLLEVSTAALDMMVKTNPAQLLELK